MKLKTQSLVIGAVFLLVILSGELVISNLVMMPGIEEIEQQSVSRETSLAVGVLEAQAEYLASITTDWSVWTDTWVFAGDMNEGYIERNLVDDTFSGIGVDAILFFTPTGDLFYGKAIDPGTGEGTPVPDDLLRQLGGLPVITSPAYAYEGTSGMILVGGEPWLIAAEPILTSDRSGPARGHVVMARRVSAGVIATITDQIMRPVLVTAGGDPSLLAGTGVEVSPKGGNPRIYLCANSMMICGIQTIPALTEGESFAVRVDMPRDAYALGTRIVTSSVGVLALFSILIVGGLFFGMQVNHVRRVEEMAGRISGIAGGANFGGRLPMTGNDELGEIAAATNFLLTTIETGYEELEMAQAAIQQSELKYRHLFEFAGDAIFILKETAIVDCNRALEATFGVPRQEIIGRSPLDISRAFAGPDEHPVEFYRDVVAAVYAGRTQRFEWTGVSRDGSHHHYEVSLSCFATGEGAFILGIMRDISERVEMENELEVANFAMDHARDMVLWVARDGGIIHANSTALEMLGYTADEVASLAVWNIDQTLTSDRWNELWPQIVTGEIGYMESVGRRKDGRQMPVEISHNYLKMENYEFDCIFMRDITAWTEVRQRQAMSLEQIEKNLLQLAILNDHIRNPLAVIVAIADLQGDENGEKIIAQARAIDGLINQLDQGWLESAKIREFLERHYQFPAETDRKKGRNR